MGFKIEELVIRVRMIVILRSTPDQFDGSFLDRFDLRDKDSNIHNECFADECEFSYNEDHNNECLGYTYITCPCCGERTDYASRPGVDWHQEVVYHCKEFEGYYMVCHE